jgi:hypothetical protein
MPGITSYLPFIILPVDLYVCETWSVILSEVNGLSTFENTALTRILGTKREGSNRTL